MPLFGPRFNVAPTQEIVTICQAEGDGANRFRTMRWGLVPSWAKELKKIPLMINARAETIVEKPSFRTAFRRRRCLIPADGFYEWQANGSKQAKQPYHIHLMSGEPIAMAGIWEVWRGGSANEGVRIESCAIITTTANETMAPLHDRMPVILDRDQWPSWLDPTSEDVSHCESLLRPCPNDLLALEPVSTYVNNARHEGEECLRPMTDPEV